MTYRLTAVAMDEVREIVRWYSGRQRGLGMRFASSLESCCCKIAANPLMGKPLSVRVRRWLMEDFPYLVLYQVRANEVLVLKVVHDRRDPEAWKPVL